MLPAPEGVATQLSIPSTVCVAVERRTGAEPTTIFWQKLLFLIDYGRINSGGTHDFQIITNLESPAEQYDCSTASREVCLVVESDDDGFALHMKAVCVVNKFEEMGV